MAEILYIARTPKDAERAGPVLPDEKEEQKKPLEEKFAENSLRALLVIWCPAKDAHLCATPKLYNLIFLLNLCIPYITTPVLNCQMV